KYSPGAWAERQLFGRTSSEFTVNAFRSARQTHERYATELRPEAQTLEGQGVLSAVESLPASAAALLGGAYYKSATLAATLMGTIVGGQSYGKGRDFGLSVEQATLYGTIDAAIEAGTELVPFARLLPGQTTGFARRALEGLTADVLG